VKTEGDIDKMVRVPFFMRHRSVGIVVSGSSDVAAEQIFTFIINE
jgi:hypothetical protein